jgi:hypothetical protein
LLQWILVEIVKVVGSSLMVPHLVSMDDHSGSLLERCCYLDISLDWNFPNIALGWNYPLVALGIDLANCELQKCEPLSLMSTLGVPKQVKMFFLRNLTTVLLSALVSKYFIVAWSMYNQCFKLLYYMLEIDNHCLPQLFYVKSNNCFEFYESIERIKALFEIELKHLTM